MSSRLVLILSWPDLAGRAESQDGSVTAGSVSVQDSVSEAGHSTAVSSHAGEHAGGKHRPSGRPRTAHSEAGSTDAASVQTMRGSEAVLGDVGDALGRDASEARPPSCSRHLALSQQQRTILILILSSLRPLRPSPPPTCPKKHCSCPDKLHACIRDLSVKDQV